MKKAVFNAKKDLAKLNIYRDSFFYTSSTDGRRTTTTQKEKNKVKREGFLSIVGNNLIQKIEFLQPNGKVLKNADFEKKTFEMIKSYREFIEENKELLD